MTTPQQQQQQDRSPTTKSLPTSPVLNVNVNLNTENSAFYSEPTFDDSAKKPTLPSPTQEATMLDIKPSPDEPANKVQNPARSTAAIDAPAAPVTPVSATANPTSPVVATQPSVAMNISTIGNFESDSDIELEDKDGPSDVTAQSNADASDSTSKQNGGKTIEEDNGKPEYKLEEYQVLVDNLQVSLEETLQEKQSVDLELNRTRGAYHDLHRQFMDLQQKLAKKDRDYEVMSKNYLEHVRLIRATDDDHGTIMDRLTQLKASIEHLIRKAQGGRSVNLNKEAVIEHFKNSGLMEGFPVPEDKLESYHLNLYMESVVMTTLVDHFFDKPLSCVFDYNKGFKEIYDWMSSKNEKLAVRWRQQLCKMLADDAATKARQEEEVATAANALSELLSKVYANTNELTKIRDICNKAFELAIAMTGLESVITPIPVALGTPFDEENMGTSLKSNTDGKVALVIFPAFKDKECAFDVRPKVWCY